MIERHTPYDASLLTLSNNHVAVLKNYSTGQRRALHRAAKWTCRKIWDVHSEGHQNSDYRFAALLRDTIYLVGKEKESVVRESIKLGEMEWEPFSAGEMLIIHNGLLYL